MNQLGREQVPFLFILDYDLNNPLVLPFDQINPEDVSFAIGKWSNQIDQKESDDLMFGFVPTPKSTFQAAFEQIQEEIHVGNTYLTNLCFRIPISLNWSLKTLFAQASAKYKLRYKEQFVFFSPETFVTITDGLIATFPMKGTIDASLPDAKNQLLNDPKEDAEHATIVDLLRNDLSRVAKKVRLKRFKYLDLVKTNRGSIWQMSSEIQGVLPKGYADKIGSILNELLPAGSITGAPKRKTLEIIRQIEGQPRGFYTGVAGVFDGQNMDSAVMIRFVEKEDNHFFYRSGGGITAQSELDKEYDELLKKVYVPNQKEQRFLVETIRLKNGEFSNLAWHQERMNRARRDLFGLEPISFTHFLTKSLEQYDFGQQLIKCRVIYEKSIKRIEFLPYQERIITFLQTVKLPDLAKKETQYKWTNRSIYQELLMQKGKADEVLIIREGLLTDISYANIALFDGQSWWTPAKPLLQGTTRARLLAEGVIQERKILLAEIGQYQKIRIFNAMIPWEREMDVDVDAVS